MSFGWKVLIPVSLAWIVAVAFIRRLKTDGHARPADCWSGAPSSPGCVFLLTFLVPERKKPNARADADRRGADGRLPGAPDAQQRRQEERLMGSPARDVVGSDRRLRRDVPDDVQEAGHRAVPVREGARRSRASTAGTSSTAGRTASRSASAASCAPGPARPTPSTSRARRTPRTERYSPGERYGRVYQINYLRCILCGLCIEACPTRALTMTNEYELADNNRADLIWTKDDLLAPLLAGMEQPPHAMRSATTTATTTGSRPPTLRTIDFGDSQPGAGHDGVLDPRAADGASPRSAWCSPARRCTAALCLAVVMIGLAVLYAAQGAPFLFAVQIIVYTGAIMMLFLFVLMLVGVETPRLHARDDPGPARCWLVVVVLFGVAGVTGDRRRRSPARSAACGGPARTSTAWRRCCSARTSWRSS